VLDIDTLPGRHRDGSLKVFGIFFPGQRGRGKPEEK
jgi:hypothetical protein